MMRTTAWLAMGCLLSVGAVGCGDDGPSGTDGGMAEGGPPANCPHSMDVPQPDGFMGACCYRKSNAMSLAAPELRIAGFSVSTPAALGNVVVAGLLAGALDEERFNWLLRVTGADADGEVTITTGLGERAVAGSDVTFAFVNNGAPMPGPADRWNPIVITGTLTGETISAPRLDEIFTLPIFDDDRTTLVVELPLSNLELVEISLSEDRSCVGTRRASSYDTADGHLTAFMPLVEADLALLKVGCDAMGMNCTMDTTLCGLIIGQSGVQGSSCADFERSMWDASVQPDSL